MEGVGLGAATVADEGIVAMQVSSDEGLNQSRGSGEERDCGDVEERVSTGLRDGDTFPRTWEEQQEGGRGAGRQIQC